jgi:hypothetical protein
MTVSTRCVAISCALSIIQMGHGSQLISGTGVPIVRLAVREQKFCLGQPGFISPEKQPPDAITLRLLVDLFYRNTSSKPLILPVSEYAAIVLSRNPADVTQRKSQLIIPFRAKVPSGDENLSERGIDLSRPREPFFEIIQPHEEGRMSLTEYVILRVHDPSGRDPQGELLGKRVFLQLELDHHLTQQVAQDLARQWHAFGDLWTGKIRTQPVELNISSSPVFADCSLEYKID